MGCQEDIPAGRIAFDSSTICVVRSEVRTDGCASGSARLKLDLVAISLALICSVQTTCVVVGIVVMFAAVRMSARERCGERVRVRADLVVGGDMTLEALTEIAHELRTTTRYRTALPKGINQFSCSCRSSFESLSTSTVLGTFPATSGTRVCERDGKLTPCTKGLSMLQVGPQICAQQRYVI